MALDVDTVWMLTLEEAKEHAQQHSAKGVSQFYRRADTPTAGDSLKYEKQMRWYLELRAQELFPGQALD